MRKFWLGLAVTSAAVSLWAERQPIERYQQIISRQMFGELPPNFDPDKMPSEVQRSSSKEEGALTKEQEKIKSAIKFTSINLTPDGETAVGFTDNSDPKNPHHYYLKVGESQNGWELREADAVETTMTIAKGDVVVSLSLGSDSAKGAGTTEKAGSGSASAPTANAEETRPRRMRGRFGKLQLRNEELAKKNDQLAQEQARQKEQTEDMRQEFAARLSDMREELMRARAENAAEAESQSGESNSDGR